MNYITVKEASVLWHIDVSTIGKMLRGGKIAGATKLGGHWVIPRDAPKPVDGRTRKAKSEEKTAPFHFPLFVNREEQEFYPVLSEEEKRLRAAELDYYACRFDEAQGVFEDLLKNTNSVYIKIMSLFYLCSLSVVVYKGRDFKSYYSLLQITLAGDFPYKKEMEIVIPWLYTVLVQYQMTSKSFTFDVAYEYSESVLPLLAYLSIFHISNQSQSGISPGCFDSYELLTRRITKEGAYYEACELHFILFCAYYLMLNEEAMLYHLKKGMDIAKEHDILMLPSGYLPYYPDAFEKIAGDYPDEFMDKIKQNSIILSKSFSEFTQKYDITKIYSRLSDGDYRYVLFAISGTSNHQVAKITGLSERTVAKKYSEIYNKLGVSSKHELIKEMSIALGNKM